MVGELEVEEAEGAREVEGGRKGEKSIVWTGVRVSL